LLRVEEAALADVASRGAVPAQQIGAEWRFLKGALVQWLHYGQRFHELIRIAPHAWPLEHLVVERLVSLLEQRLLARLDAAQQPPKPGSKQAVGKHVGVFEQDRDMEQVLAGLAAIREAGAGEGGK